MLSNTSTIHELDCAGRSSVGPRQPGHERFLIGHLGKTMLVSRSNTRFESETRVSGPSQGHLLVVADGMGAARAGGAAAETAIETMAGQLVSTVPWFFHLDVDLVEELERHLLALVARCQSDVADTAQREHGTRDAAALTAAYVLWPRMYVAHVGDGRAYLSRKGRLRQITREVTPATPGSAAAENRPCDVRRIDLELGDRLLLCTRGLAQGLSPSHIERVLGDEGHASDLVEALIETSARNDPADERTAVVARFRAVA